MRQIFGLLGFCGILVACGGTNGSASQPCPTTPDAGPVPMHAECESGVTRPCASFCEATNNNGLRGVEACESGHWSGLCRPTAEEQDRCIPIDNSPSHMIVDLDRSSASALAWSSAVIASDPQDSVNHPSLNLLVVNDGGQGTLDEGRFEATALLIQNGSATPVDFDRVVTSCGVYQGETQLARALADTHGLHFTAMGLHIPSHQRPPSATFQLRCDYHPTVELHRGGWIEIRIGAIYDSFRTRESNGWAQGTLVLQQNSGPIAESVITVITNDQ